MSTSTELDVQPQRELTAIERIQVGLRSEAFQQQVALALPEGFPAARFARIAITAIQQNDDILKANQDSIIRALLRCAQDGLLPDGREAALVRRGDSAVYQPMIGGLRKIAAEYGWTIRAKAVYAADEFTYTDEPPSITHRQARDGVDRGDLVAAYAVATHRDGRREQTVMLPADIEARKAVATTKNVWDKWPAQMWEKTVARDLFSELALSETDRRIASIIDASALAPADATALLYGPNKTQPALDAGQDPAAEGPAGSQQAAPSGVPPADGAAPGALEDALKLVPPFGVHATAGHTLADILALGVDGSRWFGTALRRTDLPEVFKVGLWAVADAHLPKIAEEVRLEASADVEF